MSASKRKWDQAGSLEPEDSPAKAAKVDEGKTASEAAAAAAAIAAKIAAQFANAGGSSLALTKDPHDGEYTYDIDINDVRNRYLLTKGSTQTQVCMCSFPTLRRIDVSSVDSRRNWCFCQHQGCLVPRSVQGNRERPTALSSHLGNNQGDPSEGCR